MQSRRDGNEKPVTPQKTQQGNLPSSDKNTNNRKLLKGNTRHQIFSDTQYIFSVSSTLETLYRYKFDPIANEVIEIRVLKRVRNGDPKMVSLRNKDLERKIGTSKPFSGTRYDVYALKSHRLVGYMLYAKETYGHNPTISSERMYFAFEKV